MTWFLPEIPASAGALLFDEGGRLLILKPTYKPGWTIPGGIMEADGETPWEACRREVLEETGLTVVRGRLAAVDSRPAKPGRKLGLRFLFDCGALSPAETAKIRLQASEISQHRFAGRAEALGLLRKAVALRVEAAWGAPNGVYLEGGRAVDGVR
ncbi:MAG: NUDIX hydrolase [Micrococcales bacterium]|nr:NUDIX hydrolase [Micrococcales bacterium]